MNFGFDYDEYNELAKTIGPVEHRVIEDCFLTVAEGSPDAFEGKSASEMSHFKHIFEHGWICARLAIAKPPIRTG